MSIFGPNVKEVVNQLIINVRNLSSRTFPFMGMFDMDGDYNIATDI